MFLAAPPPDPAKVSSLVQASWWLMALMVALASLGVIAAIIAAKHTRRITLGENRAPGRPSSNRSGWTEAGQRIGSHEPPDITGSQRRDLDDRR